MVKIKERLAAIHTHVINENWRETYFKIIHNAIYGFNLPPSPLHPNCLLKCPKRDVPQTDMWHGLWLCPNIQNFSKEILHYIDTQYKIALSLSPESLVFRCVRPPEMPKSGMADGHKIPPHSLNMGLIHATLLIAKRCITNCCLSPTPLPPLRYTLFLNN